MTLKMEKFDFTKYSDNELERITLRISHKTKEELAKMAQEGNISLNAVCVRCIEFALKNRG